MVISVLIVCVTLVVIMAMRPCHTETLEHDKFHLVQVGGYVYRICDGTGETHRLEDRTFYLVREEVSLSPRPPKRPRNA